MELQEFLTTHKSSLKKHRFPLVLGISGLILLGYGLISLFAFSQPQGDFSFKEEGGINEATQSASVKDIVVDVEGAVKNPGVYHLETNARIQDAIEKAGGLADNAYTEWIAKNINLAGKLVDGGKVYIPVLGESPEARATTLGVTTNSTSLININAASITELDTLSGVGEVTAQKIVDGRPYTDIHELVSKKIVGEKTFEKIKDLIIAQ